MTERPTGQGSTPHESAADRLIEQDRRKVINNLALSSLRRFNYRLQATTIETLFLNQDNILSSIPVEEVLKENKQTAESLEGYKHAVNIARFYWEHPELEVPTRVAYLSRHDTHPELTKDPNEKVLVWINGVGVNTYSDTYTFEDFRKRRFGIKVPQKRPDVYIADMTTKPFRDRKPTEYYKLEGAENLIIGGDIETHRTQFVLSIYGDCVLMPSAKMRGENISINARSGTVTQERDTSLMALEVNCQEYIQNGGELTNPSPEFGVINALRFTANGGTRSNHPQLDIRSADYLDTIGTRPHEQAVIANQMGFQPDEIAAPHVSEEESVPLSREAWQERMDESYHPDVRNNIDDGTQIRGYTFSTASEDDARKVTIFLSMARSAGWDVDTTVQHAAGSSIILKKQPS